MALKYEVNKIQINLANYRHYIRGVAKIGKTSLFRDFIMELYGDPKFGLLISLGQENGYKLLDNLTAMNAPDWYEFVTIVDDLVDNRTDNEFKFVCLDTVDRAFEIAEKRVLDIHRTQKGEIATSIDAALGGFAKGKAKARSLVEEQVSRLENAGYGSFWLGHTKAKQLGDQVTETVYEKITGSLEFKYDALFSDRADFIPMIATESIAKDEKLKESKRYIYFRSTPNIDAGSRIDAKYFPDKVEYSAKNYIEAVTKALESAAGVSGKSADKIRKEEENKLIESGKKFSEKEKEERYGNLDVNNLADYKAKMMELAKQLSPEDRDSKKAELSKAGLPAKFTDIEDVEVLKKIYSILARTNI